MLQILELLSVIAIILMALAVMTGAIEPDDVFRRLGTGLVLLLVVPALITSLIRTAVAPLLAAVVTVLVRAASTLVVVAVVALLIWIALRIIGARWARHHNDTREE